MHCTDVQQNIDDYLDGVLEHETVVWMESHLVLCEKCNAELEQSRYLLTQLEALPLVPMRAGFMQQAFKQARDAHEKAQKPKHKHWFAAGFGGALAAGVMMALVLGPMKTMFMPAVMVTEISMSVQESRTLNVVFNAPEAMDGVELELVLTDGLELAGRPGKRQLRWQTSLKAGKNRLTIPVRALRSGNESLVARLHSNGQQKEFRIQLDVNDAAVNAAQQHSLWI